MKYLFITLFTFSLLNDTLCQEQYEFVPNGSFEQILKQTEGHAYLDNVKFWFNPSGQNHELSFGTPDHLYINNIIVSKWIKPLSGKSTVGLITYLQRVNNYREYISIGLKSPLKKGTNYTLSFFISSGNIEAFGNIPTNNIGVLLSTSKPSQNGFKPIKSQLNYNYDSTFYQTNWKQIKYTFTADSVYKYLTIGNFKNDFETYSVSEINGVDPQSYIFIDDVSLIETPKSMQDAELNTNYSSDSERLVINTKRVDVQHLLKTNTRELTIRIWDDKNVDGDIITLLLNNQVLLYKYRLNKKKKKIKINLPQKVDNQIIMIADNLGTSPPNTAALKIIAGKLKQYLELESDLESSGAIKIEVR